MLCRVCQAIKFEPLAVLQKKFTSEELPKASAFKVTSRGPFYYPHQPSAADLQSSGNSGCHLCSQIWFSYGGPDNYVPDTGRFWLDYRLLGDETVPRTIRVSSTGGYQCPFLDFTLPETVSLPLRITDPLVDSTTGSNYNLQLAKSWLDECINHHGECISHQREDVAFPTRVIDVSSSKLFLHLSKGEPGIYAILSHCWGKHPIMTTIKNNLEQRHAELPSGELSKTFQDAVVVTRALGIQYLWIDSICIIQDSQQDWEIESSNTGKYYASAKVTIAAKDAPDGSTGCLVNRNPLKIQPCLLEIQLHGSNNRVSVVTSQSPLHQSRTGGLNRTPRFMSLLDSRAWCLQEIIMSPRMLSFGFLEMSWTCLRGQQFEGQLRSSKSAAPLQTDFFRTLHDVQALISAHGADCKHNIWFDIVEEHIQRALTYPSDTLPGLSGLAHEFHALTPDDTYLAGLWRSDIARSLLWRTPSHQIMKQRLLSTIPYEERRNIPFARRSADYRAPSWSWASIDNGFVNWDHVREFVSVDGEPIVHLDPDDGDEHAHTCVDLVDANMVLLGEDPFGRLRDATLTLRGRLRLAEVWAWEESVEGRFIDGMNLRDPDTRALIGRIDADDAEWRECPVWCLPVLRHAGDSRGEPPDGGYPTFCLALRPVEGRDEECYVRIGVAVVTEEEWWDECELRDVNII